MAVYFMKVKYKTAADFDKESTDAANSLPIFKKRAFHRAMFSDGKKLGEAKEIAGIESTDVAAKLLILIHDTVYIPKNLEDIK
jgi:hypothetical protein